MLAIGALAALMFIQVLVADIVGLKFGHKPGSDVQADHNNLHFRTVRTVANTNESITVFVLLVMFALGMGASSEYTGYITWGFVTSRLAYAICYYANLPIMRSVCVALSLVMLIALCVVAVQGS